MNKQGFTLAEVLIALVVIGIIAALTMTIFVPAINERAMSQRQVNIVRKITAATDQMRVAGELTQFATTMDFVNVLKKYLKITKICDSSHIADCWPTKTVTDQNGEIYNVADAKTRGDLGFLTNDDVPNVGIVLADGATLIMTYDPNNKGLSLGDQLSSSNIDLPVGLGKTENFNYTTNSTSGLDFVLDVNGGKGPNSEMQAGTTKLKDIRNLNKAHFGTGCLGVKTDGKCYFWTNSSPEPLDCTPAAKAVAGSDSEKYCPNTGYDLSMDYWAGANKYCKENNGSLMTMSDLESFCLVHGRNGDKLITNIYSWSSEVELYSSYYLWFGSCGHTSYGRISNAMGTMSVLCKGN